MQLKVSVLCVANPLSHCLLREIQEGAVVQAMTTIIQETAAEIAERFPIEMEAIGMEQNHIHLLGSTHPKVAPGRIVQRFKSITVRELFRRDLVVKRVL